MATFFSLILVLCCVSVSISCPTGYTHCVDEGEVCGALGIIAYGFNGRYTYRESQGSIACNNAVFGDPTPNKAKECCSQITPLTGPLNLTPIVGIISCEENITAVFQNNADIHYWQLSITQTYDITYKTCQSDFDTRIHVYNDQGQNISIPYCAATMPSQLPNTYYIQIHSQNNTVMNDAYHLSIICETLSPTPSPTTNPTTITNNPTPSPTGTPKVPCPSGSGMRWCYYIDLYPLPAIQTSNIIYISNEDDSQETFFEIHFTVIGNHCVSPTVTFEFEEIDFSFAKEYLAIYQNDGSQLTNCTGAEDNNCGNWITCIDGILLRDVTTINKDQNYTITVYESSYINDLCEHPYSINAILTITCSSETVSPTFNPIPAAPTSNPIPSPTHNPTAVTNNPTPSPTGTPKVPCPYGTGNRWCYYIDLNPLPEITTSNTVYISNSDDNSETFFEIHATVIGNHCVNPTVTFEFEETDFNTQQTEYLTIYQNDGTKLQTCTGIAQSNCGNWITCINETVLGDATTINKGETYTITLYESDGVNDISCPYSINAILTVMCSVNTLSPTAAPTNNPTNNPTELTINPTPAPTGTPKVPCPSGSGNRWCYYIDLYPLPAIQTSNIIYISNEDDSQETFFEIHATVIGNHCVNPTITFEFEEIDFNQEYEYLAIYQNDSIQLTNCTGTIDYNCGNWITCINGSFLGDVTTINKGGHYTITVYESAAVDDLCDHSYSINAILTITCSADTLFPTPAPTINPTSSPTDTPTTVTNNPTSSPTHQPTTSLLNAAISTDNPTSVTIIETLIQPVDTENVNNQNVNMTALYIIGASIVFCCVLCWTLSCLIVMKRKGRNNKQIDTIEMVPPNSPLSSSKANTKLEICELQSINLQSESEGIVGSMEYKNAVKTDMEITVGRDGIHENIGNDEFIVMGDDDDINDENGYNNKHVMTIGGSMDGIVETAECHVKEHNDINLINGNTTVQ